MMMPFHSRSRSAQSTDFFPIRVGVLQRAAVDAKIVDDVPSIVNDVLHSSGQPLDAATRTFMEPRFGHDFSRVPAHAGVSTATSNSLSIGPAGDRYEMEADQKADAVMQKADFYSEPRGRVDFSQVRLHTDERAAASANSMNALAYTAGRDMVFGTGQYVPHTNAGKRLIAHELAHMLQQGQAIRLYRSKTAFNFGKLDDSSLVEDSFDIRKDKETKPWIQLITVEFSSKTPDADGNNFWSGTASVEYYDNPAKIANFSFSVAGGSVELGKTDKGSFRVQRIEGIGYNSGSFSGTEGVDYTASEREGPRKRYSKDLRGNMSFAVFYNKGEALHAGPLDYSSHGCVHVDWTDYTNIKQVNYHSVIGLTKVVVKYI